jgi:hypothetical protein
MNHNSIGTLSSNAQIWDPKNVYMNKILQKNSTSSVIFYSCKIRWAGHVARMGEERGCIGSWCGNRRERDRCGDLGAEGWIILGWISRRWDVGILTGLGWHRKGTGGGRL